MPLHPAIAEMLAKAAELPPAHSLPIETLRANDLARFATGVPKDEVASVEDRTIPGPAGAVPVRLYRPTRELGLPVTVFFHGGGFCVCSIETHDAMCRQIARRAGTIVVSVGYRLAPEHPYPAGLDDCFAATIWAAENAAGFGGDPARLAVAGDSAGGNLAAAVALRARDEGGPALAAQLLIYPVTDHHSSDRTGYETHGAGFGLTRENMTRYWDCYLPGGQRAGEPYVSPIRAASLTGLPRAYVLTAEYDLLAGEGRAYAARLAEAGVPVTHRHQQDGNHGFLNWVGVMSCADEAMAGLAAWLRAVL